MLASGKRRARSRTDSITERSGTRHVVVEGAGTIRMAVGTVTRGREVRLRRARTGFVPIRGCEPPQGAAIVRDHPVGGNLVTEPRGDFHLHPNVRFLEHLARALRVLSDLVVLTGKKVNAPDLGSIGFEELRGIAPPVLVVRRKNEPSVPATRVAHANLLGDVSPLAEADQNVTARADPPLVLVFEGGDRGVDDAPRGIRVVFPRATAAFRGRRALRTHHPAKLPRNSRPLSAVLERISPASVEIEKDGFSRPRARLEVICVRETWDRQSHRIGIADRLLGVGRTSDQQSGKGRRQDGDAQEEGTTGHVETSALWHRGATRQAALRERDGSQGGDETRRGS